ncbi:MAG TPA: FAD:protein FMN transferase [Blastocatellia bacterium]|nr:FAD:protein FMN transferase [Blastocatellia bacterium]
MAEKKRLLATVLTFALLFAGAAIEPSPSASQPELRRFEFVQAHMGTQFRIVLYARDAETAARASAAAFERIARLDATMSDYRETSELMVACKQAAHNWVHTSRDLFGVLARSQQIARQSAGAFDVTVGPVVRLWRRARRMNELPDAKKLAAARRLVGYRRLRLDARRHRVRLEKAGMLIDLGGIAKGYAADAALAVLKDYGIRSALVAAGGDIVTGDAPPGSAGWTVAVRGLNSADEAKMIHLRLANAAVSTSGDAEQFVEINGVRYSHIVDPRTGRALTGRRSVTVVAPRGWAADALATAASVLDAARAQRLIDRTRGAAAHIEQMRGDRLAVSESRRWRSVPQVSPK